MAPIGNASLSANIFRCWSLIGPVWRWCDPSQLDPQPTLVEQRIRAAQMGYLETGGALLDRHATDPLAPLILPEGLVEGDYDRTQQVIERGARFGLDHHRCGHPGIEVDFLALCQLLLIDPDHGCVIWLAGPLVRQPVGRDVNDNAVNERYHALFVGREMHF